MRNYWQNQKLMETRERYIQEDYEEFEGCCRCLVEKGIGFTMDWYVFPLRKCLKHPKFYVKKALLERRKEGQK
jgi:hypothetical protein